MCASPAYREAIAESLITQDYDVFVAENMVQGLGRMREERMDVIVLDASFDPLEQGVAFITREVRLLRPSERRRLFFVYVTSGVRTMDLHAAFLHNVNLVVNPSDVEQLPEALGVSIRHYNDLYRPFNRALDIFRSIAARRIGEAEEREHHLRAKIAKASRERLSGGTLHHLGSFQRPAEQLAGADPLAQVDMHGKNRPRSVGWS